MLHLERRRGCRWGRIVTTGSVAGYVAKLRLQQALQVPDVRDGVAQGFDLGELLAGRLAYRQLRAERLECTIHVSHSGALAVACGLLVV